MKIGGTHSADTITLLADTIMKTADKGTISDITKVFIGASEIGKIYRGSALIYTKTVSGTAPVFVSAVVQNATPTMVALNYDQALDETSTPATTDYAITGKTISGVVVSGLTVELTVSVAFAYGDTITVNYTKGASPIKGAVGGFEADNLVDAPVTSYITADPDLALYISGLATPLSATQLAYINTFVAGYKSDDGLTNLSDAYDVMYYLGNETAESSLRNLVKRAHDAVAVNSPTFTPYEGWQGDGISSFIDSNYNGRTEADNLALNSASFGIYYRVTVNDGLTKLNGCWSTTADGGTANRIQLTLTSGAINAGADIGGIITPPAGGFKIVTRAVNTHQRIYINKSEQSFVRVSTKIPNQKLLLLATYNNSGNPAYFDSSQISFAFVRNGMTQNSVNYLTDRFQALMTANGKQV